MNHLGTQIIHTGRLLLRPYRRGDEYQMYRNFLGDSRVTEYVSWETYPSAEAARELLQLHLFSYRQNPRGYYEWAIVRNGEIIGSADAFDIREETESCEVGCTVGSRFWGAGFAEEALRAVIYFLFEEVGFRRISASCGAENTSARMLLENVGMRCEGRFRRAVRYRSGEEDDLLHYAVLREDLYGQ